MEEPEANSEAEEEYEEMQIALMSIIGASLLATTSFKAKDLNKEAQKVYREANTAMANAKKKLDNAALSDLLGTYILDAVQVAAVPDVDLEQEEKQAEREAERAYQRYKKDSQAIQKGMVINTRRAYLDAARIAAHRVDAVGTHKAMTEAIGDLAQKGITCYEYTRKDGVTVRVPVDVGIRRAIKSNDNLQARATSTLHAASRTTGLVEVSTTAGARKSHAKWQGKVYQLEGSSKEYPNFYKACKWGDPVDGILGYNCGHRFRPYYPELGKQYSDPLEGTGYTNAQVRELKAVQRKHENDLRKLKREREVLKKCGLDTKDVNKRIRAKTKSLDDLIAKNSKVLNREKWRETIYEKARREVDAIGAVHLDKGARNRIEKASQIIQNRYQEAYSVWQSRTLDDLNNTVKPGKQNKHIPGTKEYDQKVKNATERGTRLPSRLTIDINEVENLIRENAGKGQIRLSKKGEWSKKEICDAGKVIGYYVDKDGTEVPTRYFTIHYSKNDVHIVPAKDQGALFD